VEYNNLLASRSPYDKVEQQGKKENLLSITATIKKIKRSRSATFGDPAGTALWAAHKVAPRGDRSFSFTTGL